MKNIIKLRKKAILFSLLILLGIAIVLPAICTMEKKPVKIGFAASLTGKFSVLGTSGRNGAILAVEEVNAAGGINNRPVQLIIRDDKNDPDFAKQVDKDLAKEGVVAIIGHMTSSMGLAVIDTINKEKILLVSPTISSDKLTGLDDYFLRIVPPSKLRVLTLARYCFEKKGLKKLAGIYDLSNRAYSEEWFNTFTSAFKKHGGSISYLTNFTSGSTVVYSELVRKMLESDPEGIAIAANALDTAMLCQQLRMLGSELPVVSSYWAITDELISQGGPAVEGIVFPGFYNKEDKHKNYIRFKKNFKERFGKEPDFPALFSYEAALIILTALAKNQSPFKLKETILSIGTFEGLQGDIKIDRYGDSYRKFFLITVRNGKFRHIN